MARPMPYGTYRVLTSLCKESSKNYSLLCLFVALVGIEGRENYMVKGRLQGTKKTPSKALLRLSIASVNGPSSVWVLAPHR